MKHIRIGALLLGLCLIFSIVAMGQTEIAPNSTTSSNDSLVRVAYNTINKSDLLGAVSVYKPSDFLDKNYNGFTLTGIDAIIGGTNLWGLGGVLVLVDGAPRNYGDITANEVEQVTYLKGANAIVLYGSRAANGVILIATKRGHNGDRKSNVYVNGGINVPKMYPNYLGSAEYMKYYNQASINDGLKPLYDEKTIENFAAGTDRYQFPDVDYYSSDYLRKMTNSYSANADFSGGNDKAQFYALAGFMNENSLLKFGEGNNENITRLNIRGNIDLQLNDYIKTFVNIATIFYDARTANGNYWTKASTLHPHRFSPLIPIDRVEKDSKDAQVLVNNSRYVIDGKYLLGGTQEYLTNPIADVYSAGHNTYTSRQFQYTSGVDVDLVKLLDGLSLHGQVNIDYYNTYSQSVNNTYSVYVPTWKAYETGDSISGLAKFNKDTKNGTQNLNNTYSDQLLDFNLHFDYKKSFNQKHNVFAMLMASGLRARQTGDYQYRTNTNMGIQASYNYMQKYYADFSGAIVSSTKLAPGNRVALSPTIGLGWVLSKEDFLANSDVVDHLKLTASAGIVNTDMDIRNFYLYDEVYASTAYHSWGDGLYTNRATTIARGENLKLTYAKRKEISGGVEGSFFDNALDINVNAFYIKKDGIPVQSYTLYPSFFRTYWPETSFVPYTNYEANEYKGLDFQMAYNKKAGDFNFTLGLAGTYTVTEALVREELYADTYRNRAGKSLSAIFGLESEGLFSSVEDIASHSVQKFGEVKPGDIKYKDQNNDNIIDERDEVMIGKWSAPFYGGMHLTVNYKNFTLFALATANVGGSSLKANDYYWISGNKKYSAVVRDSWTEETKETATYPRLTTLSGDNNFRASDFWMYSTNRIDISKIQLTYALPEKALSNTIFKGLNFYVSGANLLTISENKDIMNLNIGYSPQSSFYNLGVKAVF